MRVIVLLSIVMIVAGLGACRKITVDPVSPQDGARVQAADYTGATITLSNVTFIWSGDSSVQSITRVDNTVRKCDTISRRDSITLCSYGNNGPTLYNSCYTIQSYSNGGTRLTVVVDTSVRRFSSVTYFYSGGGGAAPDFMTNIEYEDGLSFTMVNVPYVRLPDGTLQCKISAPDFPGYLTSYSSGWDARAMRVNSNHPGLISSCGKATHSLLASPASAYIEINVRR
jgi:hypothetical protein